MTDINLAPRATQALSDVPPPHPPLLRLTITAQLARIPANPKISGVEMQVVGVDVSAIKFVEGSGKSAQPGEIRKIELGAVRFRVLPDGKGEASVVCAITDRNKASERLVSTFRDLARIALESRNTKEPPKRAEPRVRRPVHFSFRREDKGTRVDAAA